MDGKATLSSAASALVRRDLRLLWRRRGDALQPALFALLTVVLFALGLGGDAKSLAPVAAAVLWLAALLAGLLAENVDVAVFTAWDNREYYHYKPQMSSLYARILSTGNNKMVQIASVVRESSRDYPRPVALEIFEYPPFLFEAEALQQCLRDMAENAEYADIRFTESSVGTVYLYSAQYLDEDYAAFLAENEDVGAIASP